MTGTPCQSAALDRIAVFFHTIVKTILTIAEIVRTTLHETMGRHARLLRHRTGFLLPSASALYAAIGAAPARITDNRKVDLEQPAEANGDDAESSWISKSLRITIQEAAANLSSRKMLTPSFAGFRLC